MACRAGLWMSILRWNCRFGVKISRFVYFICTNLYLILTLCLKIDVLRETFIDKVQDEKIYYNLCSILIKAIHCKKNHTKFVRVIFHFPLPPQWCVGSAFFCICLKISTKDCARVLIFFIPLQTLKNLPEKSSTHNHGNRLRRKIYVWACGRLIALCKPIAGIAHQILSS